MDKSVKLRWSDIWVLVSTYFSSPTEPSNIYQVIASADAINHAVINYEELSSALVRLSKVGLIKVDPKQWRLSCTQKGYDVVKSAAEKNSLAFKIWEEVENSLGVEAWLPKEPIPHPENNLVYPKFTEELYKSEVNKYLASIGSK